MMRKARKQREETVADEVAGLADHEVNGFPVGETIEAEERLGDAAEGSAGVICTAPRGGFEGEDEQAGEDRHPSAEPECDGWMSSPDGGMKGQRGRGHGSRLLNEASRPVDAPRTEPNTLRAR